MSQRGQTEAAVECQGGVRALQLYSSRYASTAIQLYSALHSTTSAPSLAELLVSRAVSGTVIRYHTRA